MTEFAADEDAASARATEQARLRKARREAKIKAGAENRLNKITGLGGGVPRDPAPAATPAPAPSTTTTPSAPASTAAAGAPSQHADPEEVDISQHFYQPQTTPRIPPSNTATTTTTGSNISDSQLRQMMLGFDQPGTATPPMPGMGAMGGMPAPPPGMEDDPMMRMMMQMLGGGGDGGNAGASNPFASLAGGMPFPTQNGQPQAQPLPNRHASLWRLLHTLVALALGLYIALYTPFTGTKLSRDRAAAAAAGSAEERELLLLAAAGGGPADDVTKNFFWAFATAEAVLLGSRYFMDRGRSRLQSAAGSGMLGMVVGFLPGGIRGKVEMAMRYGEVLGTVKGDVLVCVFVLGAAAWWRG
ncbi:Golgi to ER traffic protein 2 [Chaetomidium leptoderma]|uniref:Golgi to ER traffic protein 2 n=1 Tax=Chaetomidium leptoderma TaxID=669021 RepID=A0AAN6VUC5_9PEZI|nr:Golgi to ER traffic protein 2 [Chaetomidium leptoderma]